MAQELQVQESSEVLRDEQDGLVGYKRAGRLKFQKLTAGDGDVRKTVAALTGGANCSPVRLEEDAGEPWTPFWEKKEGDVPGWDGPWCSDEEAGRLGWRPVPKPRMAPFEPVEWVQRSAEGSGQVRGVLGQI